MPRRSTDDLLAPFRLRLAAEGSLTLSVRARPGAERTQVTDVLADGSIKLSLTAPPEDGKANEALVRYVAELFDLRAADVRIASGHTAKRKIITLTLPR